jgi:hypothetical protein
MANSAAFLKEKLHNGKAGDAPVVFRDNGNRPGMKEEVPQLGFGVCDAGPEARLIEREESVQILARRRPDVKVIIDAPAPRRRHAPASAA